MPRAPIQNLSWEVHYGRPQHFDDETLSKSIVAESARIAALALWENGFP